MFRWQQSLMSSFTKVTNLIHFWKDYKNKINRKQININIKEIVNWCSKIQDMWMDQKIISLNWCIFLWRQRFRQLDYFWSFFNPYITIFNLIVIVNHFRIFGHIIIIKKNSRGTKAFGMQLFFSYKISFPPMTFK